MTLFSDGPRHDSRPSRRSETQWKFLDRVAGDYWDELRQRLELWLDNVVDTQARSSIRSRIRSRREQDFRSALSELYVHEYLVCAGFTITYEPDLANTTRRPDFLAKRDDSLMVVEVTSRSVSDLDPSGANREASLYDAIDAMQLDDFFLTFDVEARGPRSPSPRPIVREIRDWIRGLDPDAVISASERGEWNTLPERSITTEGWDLTFRAIPIKPELRGPNADRRAIGISGGGGGIVRDAEIIRKAVAEKARAYGELNLPYLIALALDTIIREPEIEAALYGRPSGFAFSDDRPAVAIKAQRDRSGYWSESQPSDRSGVSGLLVLPNGLPYSVGRSSPSLWLNPLARHGLPGLQACEVVRPDGAMLSRDEPSPDPWEHFGLAEGWPPGEPFPKQ